MNRREAVATISTVFIAAAIPTALPAPRAPIYFGRLTVDDHLIHRHVTGEFLHVWVNGVDVTPHCFEANDRDRYALVFCRDPEFHDWSVTSGDAHLDPDNPRDAHRHRLVGDVRIRPGRPLYHVDRAGRRSA